VRGAAVGVVRASSIRTSGAPPRTCTTSWCVDDQPPSGLRRARRHARNVTTEVRFGHRHRGEDFAGGDRGSHRCFCSSVPPFTSARAVSPDDDQRSTDAEGAPRQLLGRHGPSEVLRFATGREAPNSSGYRETESAELGESGDYRLGEYRRWPGARVRRAGEPVRGRIDERCQRPSRSRSPR